MRALLRSLRDSPRRTKTLLCVVVSVAVVVVITDIGVARGTVDATAAAALAISAAALLTALVAREWDGLGRRSQERHQRRVEELLEQIAAELTRPVEKEKSAGEIEMTGAGADELDAMQRE
jgi:hypothetical protein